jgi:Uma2 family endonuclease
MLATLPEPTERLMTVEEFFELPENDGVDRMLIRGRLLENPATRRNRWHSSTEAAIAYLLNRWLRTQPKPRGRVYSGEGGFVLRDEPGSAVGIDVAYASHEVVSHSETTTRMVDGPPVLAVEILSPSDKQEEVIEKVREYLSVGVQLVWIVEPVFQTVTVYQPNARPEMFTGNEVLVGDPHMPGLSVVVSEIFED